jgi:fructose/tagatose bisphosphate aldolase
MLWAMAAGAGTRHQPYQPDRPRLWPEEIKKIEAALPSAFDIRFVFNQWTLGEKFCRETLGIPAAELNNPGFDLLRHLGFHRKPRSTRPMTMFAAP